MTEEQVDTVLSSVMLAQKIINCGVINYEVNDLMSDTAKEYTSD